MSDTSDISKMKVADLKRELKIRGLPVTGNKTELTERLQAAQIDGELSFDETAISGEDLLEDDDGVLTDEDEEKILSENELLKSPSLLEKSISIDAPTAVNSAPNITQKVVLKRKISTSILNDAVFNASDNAKPTPSKLIKSTETPTTNANANQISASGDGTVKKVAQLTAQERLDMRAKKFGVSAASNSSTVTETANTTKETTNATAAVGNSEKEADVLKKRAERFGCVVSSKMVQLDAAERLQKRKERFGGAVVAKSTTITKITVTPVTTSADTKPTNDVWAEKARLRLERFKSTEAKTVNV